MKLVYAFGGGKADGSKDRKDLLGGKGAGLAEMSNLGIPVPPGFTISTEVCTHYFRSGKQYPAELQQQVKEAIARVESLVGTRFGDAENPLLLSVRSGARASMPGMMDTILNLGLNDKTVAGLARATGNERFALDAFRRFITMYAGVVLDVERDRFEEILSEAKKKAGAKYDHEIPAEGLRVVVEKSRALVRERTGNPFPETPHDQLWGAIGAVFESWDNDRAQSYRRMYDIPEDWGTAVNVQAMVFGNLGDDSATGVCFTRDPGSGARIFYGEYLPNAQGEDVVAGIRTPLPLAKSPEAKGESMEDRFPQVYGELVSVKERLEKHFTDMQDMEFTVQRGKLWLLQTRTGKRTTHAAVRIAVEMANEGLIDRETAVMRIDPHSLDQLLHPSLDPAAKKDVIARGLPASPGAASGQIVFSSEEAEEEEAGGKNVILVRTETTPEDIDGMKAARGILTARGGMTSHAAVVARGMGKCCVAGCSDISVDHERGVFTTAKGRTCRKGEVITIDGSTGEVMLGEVPTIPATVTGDFETLMSWADGARRLRVRANADTPHDARTARGFGAQGIGLCRTEHMFFEPERISAVREMILADTEAGRRTALAKILPMQRQDFVGIFREMAGLPVTIRLLDPPLHEFLPEEEEGLRELAKSMGVAFDALERRRNGLREFNPMLGHRGVRLGVTYPEIYEVQIRAIAEAVVHVHREGVEVIPEIMIPFVALGDELRRMRQLTVRTMEEVFAEARVDPKPPYIVGTMIELPRACICADQVAEHADFFSFGTNDLTQTGFGLSRDDAAKFLGPYVEMGVLPKDPFVAIDPDGIGGLMVIAVERAKKTRPNIKLGICGEHGGEPSSVEFCHGLGLEYVSCSPFRVPVARLSAAQAAIREKRGESARGPHATA